MKMFTAEGQMEQDFRQKVVVVTGATSGIGGATVNRFIAAGAMVLAVGRNKSKLQGIFEDAEDAGRRVSTVGVDLTSDSAPLQIVSQAVEHFGGIDVLVNAAGHISSGSIEDTSLQAWDALMDINVRSVFRLMQTALPHLIERRGNIINVSSVTGLRAFPGVLAYCVSKAAVDQLTRCASLELAAKGVRVNAVNPGVVVTEIHKRGGMNDEQYAAFLERSKQTHPLGRVGQPSEVAELIHFLASEKAGWITGGTYSIDGGRAQTCAR